MKEDRFLFIYAEAPPVDDNVPAPGLYRASVPILKSIADKIAMIGLYPQDRRLGIDVLHPAFRGMARTLPRIFTWFRIIRRKFLPGDFENGLVATIVGRWARQSGASHILALEGSDPEALARIDAVAQKAGLPFSVYLVDDFEWTMRLSKRPEAEIAATKARMQASLSRARNVFAITDELGALLKKQFGINAVTLRLASEPGPAPKAPRGDQIFFLGSINFLYLSALKTMLDIVARLRKETGRNITVRFTHAAATALDPLPNFVRADPIPDAGMLAREISGSLFAFLPYAFEPSLRTMVETSFPSKSMECLAYARSIVVHAPSYSNSSRFFGQAGLPVVTDTPEALEQEIRRQLAAPPDHGSQYRTYLAEKHSLAAARETLLATLLRQPS